ncbi:hypothetical protein HMPREF9371_2185 [Neisseria shayeganii 871]|uniref:Uncharacterized protein n=1 Tax=Neisseria shayeganii 871 TaxID=1032488 RepID=G4CKP5_9NEIS|nr:hypothetical protein HMPREF9371_2185 [Neisseria shayeganii 871]
MNCIHIWRFCKGLRLPETMHAWRPSVSGSLFPSRQPILAAGGC